MGIDRIPDPKVDGIFAFVRILPILFLLVFAGIALSYPLADTDIWWHLAAGREICRIGHLPRTDLFCSSSLGTSWIDLHWGFQIATWKIWTFFGDWGLIAARVVLPFCALLVAFGRRLEWSAAVSGALCLWISRDFVDARPLLATLLLLACMQRFLVADASILRFKTICSCVVVQIGLVNTQGLFVLGPLLVVCIAGGDWLEGRRSESLRKLGLAGALLVASLANPYGIHAFELATKLATRITPGAGNIFSSEIPENASIWAWISASPTRIVAMAWLMTGLVIHWRQGPGSTARVLLLAGTFVLSAIAVRNLPLFCFEAAFCLGGPSSLERLEKIWIWSAAAVAIAFVTISVKQRQWDLPGDPVAPLRLPGDRILSAIRRIKAPVFHEIRVGGWLSWKNPVERGCWADTRLVLHDAGFVRDYLDVADDPDRFPDFVRRWRFEQALVPTMEFPRFHRLAIWLLRSRDWELVECDGAWALFRHRANDGIQFSGVDLDSISSSVSRRFRSNPRLESLVRSSLARTFEEAMGSGFARTWISKR